MLKNMIVFGDNKKICSKIFNQLIDSGVDVKLILTTEYDDKEILEIISAIFDRTLLLVFRNEKLKKITFDFYEAGITHIFILPWDTHYSDDTPIEDMLIPIENDKPRLNYIEIEISNKCNLNCKGCSEFSNLVCESKQVDHVQFEKDLQRLKGFFWGIGKIRLLGGEPLTNPSWLSFIESARRIFPDCDLRLVTNGLLIPGLTENELTGIKQNKCIVDISNYPPTRKILKKIKHHLDRSGVKHDISFPIVFFFKLYMSQPFEQSDIPYKNCLFKHCHSLGNGYLSACSHQFWAHRFNTAFHSDYPEDEKIDIYHTKLTGWDIDKLFSQPLDFCKHCPTGMIPYRWKAGFDRNKADPKDWVATNSIINTKVIPATQSLFRFIVIRLRRSTQNPRINKK